MEMIYITFDMHRETVNPDALSRCKIYDFKLESVWGGGRFYAHFTLQGSEDGASLRVIEI